MIALSPSLSPPPAPLIPSLPRALPPTSPRPDAFIRRSPGPLRGPPPSSSSPGGSPPFWFVFFRVSSCFGCWGGRQPCPGTCWGGAGPAQTEEHAFRCCMQPAPRFRVRTPAAFWGRGAERGVPEGLGRGVAEVRSCGVHRLWPRRGSRDQGVLEAGILLPLEGAGSPEGTDRAGRTQTPSATASRGRAGGCCLPAALQVVRAHVSRAISSLRLFCIYLVLTSRAAPPRRARPHRGPPARMDVGVLFCNVQVFLRFGCLFFFSLCPLKQILSKTVPG